MGGHNTTARDRVWAAIFNQVGQFRHGDVRESIDTDNRPSDETIHRVLRSATELGIVNHRSGSPYYRLAQRTDVEDARPGRGRGKSATSLIDRLKTRGEPVLLNPHGIDTEAYLKLMPDEKTEDIIFKEDDENIDIEDIISDERKMELAQSGQPDGDVVPAKPSSSDELWKSAFLSKCGDADHIVIVDTETDELVDLSDHLDMDLFEPGTKILALGELSETPLFEEIMNEIFQSYRSDLTYREVTGLDSPDLEEHVRSRIEAFESEDGTFEWDNHIEALVDEVEPVGFDRDDPRNRTVIREWVRTIAREEVTDE